MEKKNDRGLKHVAHKHFLVLNENYIAKESDVCIGCREQIYSCKSFVYSCSNLTIDLNYPQRGLCRKFLLHKTCAELPLKIVNPTDQNKFLSFERRPVLIDSRCTICGLEYYRGKRFGYCSNISNTESSVCFKCAVFLLSKEDLIFVHPGHSHPLALIQHPSSFQCYACKVNDNILDSSYRCTKCEFWMHKSCGDAPDRFQFPFHKHPLILLFFLPEIYRIFDQFCRICNERLHWVEWLYCCRSCRYFTHFRCARSRSSPVLSSSENELNSNLVHLPAADEISLNLLLEQFITDKVTLSHSYNGNSISGAANYIKHWSHEQHDLKLITINELYDGKNDNEMLLLCDGCVKPIQTTCDSLFFACVPCKYFMHKVCAELPREVEHHLWPGNTLFAKKYTEPSKLFECSGCGFSGNGIFFINNAKATPFNPPAIITHLHIGCATLPKVIKHEAHQHQLQLDLDGKNACSACGRLNISLKYRCNKCKFYICGGCIRTARTYEHRWDPHPLDLKYDAGMVEEHEHEFDCEYCSEEIDTNYWFYHCGKCDLSFHTHCILESSDRYYKDVKFGGTVPYDRFLHRGHGLTLVLNKKVGRCRCCDWQTRGRPVLQCAPCNIRHGYCYLRPLWCWVIKYGEVR